MDSLHGLKIKMRNNGRVRVAFSLTFCCLQNVKERHPFFKVVVLWATNPSWTHPVLYQQFNASVIAWCISTGDNIFAHFGFPSTSPVLFKCQHLSEYCSWPMSIALRLQSTHLPTHYMSQSSHHSNGFLNTKKGSVWLPHSPALCPIKHLGDVVEQEIGIMDVQLLNLE